MRHILKSLVALGLSFCILSVPVSVLSVNAEGTSIQAVSESPDFSAFGAVGAFSSERTQALAKTIYDGLKNHKESIVLDVYWNNLDNDTMEDVAKIYRAVLCGWDVGIITSRYSVHYSAVRTGQKYYVAIVPDYFLEGSEYDAVYDKMMQELDKIISGVNSEWSDEEKALYLHDYLAVKYNYDYDRVDEEISHFPYAMMESGYGVCEAYARLYNILLHRVGIDSAMVECVSMKHAWNLIQLNGKWYHVDITWDDNYQEHAGLVKHVNFIKTTEEMLETNHSYTSESEWILSCGRAVNQMPTSDFYRDAFWNDCNAQIVEYQGKWLAIHCNSTAYHATSWFDLCDYDANTATAEITHLISLDVTWDDFEDKNRYWGGSYISPVVVNDVIYYTTPEAVYALKETGVEWLFDLDSEQMTKGYIYGMTSEGNTLYYYVSSTPISEPEEYTYQLEEAPEIISATTTSTTTSTTTQTTTSTTTSTTLKTTTSTTTSTTPKTTTSTTTSTTSKTTTSTTTSTTPKTTTSTTTSTTPETTTSTTTSTTPETTTSTTTSTTPETTTETEKVTETETQETKPVEPYGDLDGDYQITIDDIILIQKYLLNQEPFTETQYRLADITQDEAVDIYDFIALKRMLLNESE